MQSNLTPIPNLIEDETSTVPTRLPTMRELFEERRIKILNPLWDRDNGVDDRDPFFKEIP